MRVAATPSAGSAAAGVTWFDALGHPMTKHALQLAAPAAALLAAAANVADAPAPQNGPAGMAVVAPGGAVAAAVWVGKWDGNGTLAVRRRACGSTVGGRAPSPCARCGQQRRGLCLSPPAARSGEAPAPRPAAWRGRLRRLRHSSTPRHAHGGRRLQLRRPVNRLLDVRAPATHRSQGRGSAGAQVRELWLSRVACVGDTLTLSAMQVRELSFGGALGGALAANASDVLRTLPAAGAGLCVNYLLDGPGSDNGTALARALQARRPGVLEALCLLQAHAGFPASATAACLWSPSVCRMA